MKPNDEACLQFGHRVLLENGLEDWTITWSDGDVQGVTLWDVREICIGWESGDPDFALMAHEVAHAVAGQEARHDGHFADVFTEIVRRHFVPAQVLGDLGRPSTLGTSGVPLGPIGADDGSPDHFEFEDDE